MHRIDAIAAVCQALSSPRGHDTAIDILNNHYPLSPTKLSKARCTPFESTRVFLRDGFIDRYSGDRLIFPPVFRAISQALPKAFPFHPNWKADQTHPGYWELGATIDHYQALAIGGKHEESNWFTTSMARNSAKLNWSLEHLGWKFHEPGDLKNWDGLLGWFLEYTESHPELLDFRSVQLWHSAAKQALIN